MVTIFFQGKDLKDWISNLVDNAHSLSQKQSLSASLMT